MYARAKWGVLGYPRHRPICRGGAVSCFDDANAEVRRTTIPSAQTTEAFIRQANPKSDRAGGRAYRKEYIHIASVAVS